MFSNFTSPIAIESCYIGSNSSIHIKDSRRRVNVYQTIMRRILQKYAQYERILSPYSCGAFVRLSYVRNKLSQRTKPSTDYFQELSKQPSKQLHNHYQQKHNSQQEVQRKTIFAFSSGAGKAGIAVVRVSGPECRNVMKKMTGKSIPKPRTATQRKFYCPSSEELIDNGLLLWFPAPTSFTGDDVCELHVHGGLAVIQAIMRSLGGFKGVHLAEPGEFTKRAFLNNKLDLTEVEGLADLISAETEIQRRQAVRQMEGELGKQYKSWRQKLLTILAHVEAYIDFSEDENIEDGVLDKAKEQIFELISEVASHLNDNRRGERLRSGVNVAIIGQPNVGKSSLLNILCQRPAAIVSDIAGTTRDIVESSINIGGYPVLLSDTAGIRKTRDKIEEEGVLRAQKRASDADLVLLMMDVTSFKNTIFSSETFQENIIHHLTTHFKECLPFDLHENSYTDDPNKHLVLVLNKSDLCSTEQLQNMHSLLQEMTSLRFPWILVSCQTKSGIEDLLQLLNKHFSNLCGNPLVGSPSLTQERHRILLSKCLTLMQQINIDSDVVISAEYLRLSLRELGKITGHVRTEEILDIVFKDFCIGK